ncbi:composite domain of metallo-dependent hydrolase [Hesseltinella vesiculosa]|uniref:Composite domain of metallo-dependent hydrolase n=1 Tax=Hesseltinella vesiculosa TaxID=101127 RepID=A0A1X2GAY7_9FUNG|nr:composite domain of metallo-dependent hydrolase [Hesseltinella vesiculosa]
MATGKQQQYQTIPDYERGGSGPSLTPSSNQSWLRRAKRPALYLFLGLVVVALVVTVSLGFFVPHPKHPTPWQRQPVKAGITVQAQQEGIAKCEAIQAPRVDNVPRPDRVNPRGLGVQPVLLTNANVWDGEGGVLEQVQVLLVDGVVSNVAKSIHSYPKHTKVIDVKGHIVSPGLVDMHSHIGVDSWPGLWATDDTNEMTSPITPFVRSIDGFNPSDKAIRIVASGGVTSVLVLPGSGNLIGGEAFAFKLRHVNTTSNEDMLVQAHIDQTQERRWRYEKHACGENAKRVYGELGQIPSTRLGEGFLFRKAYDQATKLRQAQDDWCAAAQRSPARLESRFPEVLELEALVAILRGDVRLNVHCYETHDLEAFLRHSFEYNFTVAAFHHALDAYRVPDILKRAPNNITIATFADHWGYKKEAFQGSPKAPRILLDAGIPVALKSDHPVLNSQHLLFEAAKAHHYGLTEQEAFQAVTSVPARAMGLDHRVGSLKIGYDADVVIWDRSPLELGAAPLQVFVDGVPLFDEPVIESPEQKVAATPATESLVKDPSNNGVNSFVLTNIGRNFLDGDASTIVVEQGKIVCQGECAQALTGDLPSINLQGGYVVPGFVAVGSSLGLVEISSEDSTGDGVIAASTSQDPKQIVEAVDGIKLGTRHLEEAYKGGILSAITAPMSSNVVLGVSAAFKTGGSSVLTDGTLINPHVALHVQIGNAAKSASFPSVSTQIQFLRRILQENKEAENAYGEAARGDIPTIVQVNGKDEIATLLRLKQQIPSWQPVILGGTEAYLLAEHLAKAKIPVILSPALCTPGDYEQQHCLTGAPLTNETAAHVLHRHGVKIGLGVVDDGLARNLVWDAGWLASTSKDHQLTEDDAIRFVSTNLQEIFYGTRLGQAALQNDFTVYSGHPFDMTSQLVLVHTQENGLEWVSSVV